MRPLFGGLIVFGTSAAVLALEILAVRLLAPYLGITIEVTTGVIGTVLAGIALGTWLGGRLADRVAQGPGEKETPEQEQEETSHA